MCVVRVPAPPHLLLHERQARPGWEERQGVVAQSVLRHCCWLLPAAHGGASECGVRHMRGRRWATLLLATPPAAKYT